MRVHAIATLVLLSAAVTVAATAQVTSDRIAVLENQHGYFPCMDCHGDQETIATPRILEEDHVEPLEWEDEDGNVHLVPFGRKVALADLLGLNGTPDIASENLAKIGTRLNIEDYMEDNGLAPADSIWTLVHGGGNIWCLNCHDAEDRDKLKGIDGELITFNESQRLCGGCHGPILRDWESRIHGRTTGYWAPAMGDSADTVIMLCVECHPAHDPVFPGVEPMAGPVTRLDGPGGGSGHDAGDHAAEGPANLVDHGEGGH